MPKHYKTNLQLRDELLTRRGLVAVPSYAPVEKHSNAKTPKMKLAELKHQKPIEELLADGGLSELADKLGVDQATVWRWRQLFGINATTSKTG